ncbi:uncharacterized protein LOC122857426 [Aphidius gifuensis]|uniref:uncharacterized protein LOC122857426 n=1 Tax=Aphidius gifuensis TaxID=684658 RepID=UPI001CDBBE6E|nr:uncharacterized protein LOC122857426 [Aphidius gifuensis]
MTSEKMPSDNHDTDIIRAKCSDNSIVSAYTAPKVLLDMDDVIVSGIPDFNRKFKHICCTPYGRMDHGSWGIRATSSLERKAIGPLHHPAVDVTKGVMFCFPDSPQPDRVPPASITFTAPIHKGRIERELISVYLKHGQPDMDTLESILTGNLMAANQQLHRDIGAYIDCRLELIDNMAFYAKGLWQALLIDFCNERNFVPQATAWEANDFRVKYIDLSNIATTADQLGSAIKGHGFVFIENSDYSRGTHDLVLEWICQPNRRIATPKNKNIPHMAYVSWPYIPITVARHGAFEPLGVPTVIDSDTIYSFLRITATNRNEHEALSRAISWVQQNCGVEFIAPATRNGLYRFIWPDNGTGNIGISAPSDYNALLRMLKVTPKYQPAYDEDNTNFIQSLRMTRLNLAALYTGLFNAFVTTVMASVHFDTSACQRWADGETEDRSLIHTLRDMLLRPTTSGEEPAIYYAVAIAFKVYTGCNINSNINASRNWSTNPGSYAHAYDSYRLLNDFIAPVRGNLLALDYWMITRPIEWGIPGDPCEVNFSKNVSNQGPPASWGWHASSGDSTFQDAASGKTPYMIIPYGPLGMNIIAQAFDLANPVFKTERIRWAPNDLIHRWKFDQSLLEGAVYDAKLRCYWPCTIRTFDHDDQIIAAPVYPTPSNVNAISILGNWNGKTLGNVGYWKPILGYTDEDILPILKRRRNNNQLFI